MLSIFRTNQIFTSVLLIFYIIILWVAVLFVPFQWIPEANGILAENLYNWTGSSNWTSRIIAIFILLINGTLINYLVAEYRISNEVNLFPGLFYVLVSSAIPDFLHLSPILLANSFLLFSLTNLFNTYKKKSCADLIFNIGFWIGIASLFYSSYLLFVIMGLIGLGIMRSFKIQERVIILIGAFLPYFLFGTYYFWIDQFDIFWQQQFTNSFQFLDFTFISNSVNYAILGSFVILVLFVFFNYGNYQFKKNIQVQKKISVLYWVLIIGLLTFLFQADASLAHLQILAIPLGIFLGLSFTDMKKSWAESFHFILLVLVFALQYHSLLI